ncbi:MAG: VOC family protein, partial [Pseudomonadota bacterium]
MAATLTQITPFVPCTSLQTQINFYQGVLGFEIGFQAENYAFLRRDAVAIRLVEVWRDVELSKPDRAGSFYIDVRGLDALYDALKDGLNSLPAGR